MKINDLDAQDGKLSLELERCNRQEKFVEREEAEMNPVLSTLRTLSALPTDQLILLVALGALALAGFAIYVVHSVTRTRRHHE